MSYSQTDIDLYATYILTRNLENGKPVISQIKHSVSARCYTQVHVR